MCIRKGIRMEILDCIEKLLKSVNGESSEKNVLIPTIQKVGVDIFLAVALGQNQYIHQMIDEIYEEKKWTYYEAYKANSQRLYNMDKLYTVEVAKKIQQVYGIITYEEQNRDSKNIEKLINHGYKYEKNVAKKADFIILNEVMKQLIKKDKNLGEDTGAFLAHVYVLVYLMERKTYGPTNIGISPELDMLLAKELVIDLTYVLYHNDCDKYLESCKSHIAEVKNDLALPANHNFDNYYDLIIHIRDNAKKNLHTNAININKMNEDMIDRVFIDTDCRFIKICSAITKGKGLYDTRILVDTPISNEEVDRIILMIVYNEISGVSTSKDRIMVFILTIYMHCILKTYHHTKTLYLDDSAEELYIENKIKQEELDKKIKEIELLESNYKKEIAKRDGVNDELRKENALLTKELQKLKKELENREDYKKEVVGLREFAYKSTESYDKEETVSLEEMIMFLESRKGAIVGGRVEWVNKLKEVLPKYVYITIEDINKDFSYLNRVNTLYVYTGCLSHALYRNVMSNIDKTNISVAYINSQTNIELTIRKMYELQK